MIAVTGATGFIGSALVWQLNQAGFTNLLLVDSAPPENRPGILTGKKFSRFLLHKDFLDFLKTPESKKITHIFHMGANSSTTETNVAFLKENNTDYTRLLWDWCTENQRMYVYASSAATYGAGEKGFSDTTPFSELSPLNPYGNSKLAFDQWAIEQKKAPPQWYGLRFFNVYGPNEYFKGPMMSLVAKAYEQICETGKLKLFISYNPQYKDGEQMRDFVYVKDVTRWMLELTEKKPTSGVYNMGSGNARTWLDLAKATFGAIGKPMQIEWIDVPENIRNQYQYFTEAGMDKWLKAGMSRPQWPIEKGVQDYVQNFLMKDKKIL
ncbi:MAG: ADP-glyceromanno-heptose 6-epimerase [Pseudobdellovibrionaceae bacterium]